MKLYIALSIAFLILISAALGAVGGAGTSDTGSTVQQQAVSQQGSGYPVPPISSSTEEQLAAEKLGLSIPQMDSFTPDEGLGFVSATRPSASVQSSVSSSVQSAMPGSSVWYYPSSIASANRFYVGSNSGLSTVGGCSYRGYLPLWAEIKTSGNFYVYEWYPGQSTYSVQWMGWTAAGWKKGWFLGDTPGWHILCYNSGIWSNYIYIYVYPLSASTGYASSSSGMTAATLPSGAPTPVDPGSEGLIMPDYNLYRPASQMASASYNYPTAASTTAELMGNPAVVGAVSSSPSPVSYPYQSVDALAQGKMKTVSTAKTCTTCKTCTSSTSIAGGVSSVCPYDASCNTCSPNVGGSAPQGYVAQSLQAVYPLPSVCKCNEYYVQVCEGELETVAGVFCGEWLPLWSKVNRAGAYWSFEWTVCSSGNGYYCSPEVKSFGNKNVGWHETWFKGNEPGWHILSYHCNDWSNYIYIYVWPAD